MPTMIFNREEENWEEEQAPGPLWQAMHDAYWRRAGCHDEEMIPPPAPECNAAEIRAVADWIEQLELNRYSVVIPDVCEVLEYLREEADNAEGYSQ